MWTPRKIKCERCGFYCEAPYVWALADPPAFLNYLRSLGLVRVVRLEGFKRA